MKVLLECKDFSALADEIIASLSRGSGVMAPTFAFVDPFGYSDVTMAQLAVLLNSPKSEILVYLDTNSVNRFATGGIVDPRFEALFGTDEFKSAPPARDPLRMPFLVDLYERQLRNVARFPYTRTFEMRNHGNRVVNHMVFGTRKVLGLDKMKQVMWKVDPSGGYAFSDHLNGQDVLFVAEPSTTPLREALLRRFGGLTATIEQVCNYTVTDTPYHSLHVKKRTLKAMEADGLIAVTRRARASTYPDGCLISFVTAA